MYEVHYLQSHQNMGDLRMYDIHYPRSYTHIENFELVIGLHYLFFIKHMSERSFE